MFNGDFEDATTEHSENGVQKAMADFYGDELKVTVYKLSHHAAERLANKPITCQAHAPKAVFTSGNTWYTSYRHPRCTVIDRFRDEVGTLCRPLDKDPASPFFCSEHPGSVADASMLQRVYTCGEESMDINGGIRTVSDNDLAIYSTAPDVNMLNLIKFSSDGVRWGFTNNFSSLITRDENELKDALDVLEPDDDDLGE